jgi:hypothetical protein
VRVTGTDDPLLDKGEQGAGDGAEVVHGPLEAVGPPVDAGLDDVGQEGVAGRATQAVDNPGPGAEDADLPDSGGGADEAGEDGGGGVTGDGLGAATVGSSAMAPPPSRAAPARPSEMPR